MKAKGCAFAGFLGLVSSARAGMTVYDLNDVVRHRLEDISFFVLLLGVCALGVKFLWNFLARDLPRLPRLGFGRALCLTGLLSLAMLLVLSMISGARELLTPGAWRRQGSAYRLNDTASDPMRRQSLESLRTALQLYSTTHEGRLPPHDFVPEIPEKIWQSPDSLGTRYMYVSELRLGSGTNIVACEPVSLGNQRFALLSNGEVLKLPTDEIRRRLGITGGSW